MPSARDRITQHAGSATGKQSWTMSLVEAITNVIVGYLLVLLTQLTVFPLFGVSVSMSDNLVIGGIFTMVSLLRSFALRRLFEAERNVC